LTTTATSHARGTADSTWRFAKHFHNNNNNAGFTVAHYIYSCKPGSTYHVSFIDNRIYVYQMALRSTKNIFGQSISWTPPLGGAYGVLQARTWTLLL